MVGCARALPSGNEIPQPEFPVAVLTKDLEVGTLWAAADRLHTLHLRNNSSSGVELVDLKTTCGCTTVKPSSITLPPGAWGEVTLKLHVDDRAEEALGPRVSSFRTDLVPIVSGYLGSPPRWELTGSVRKLLTLSTPLVDFDGTLVQGHPFPVEAVRVTSAVPLSSLEAKANSEIASIDLTRHSGTTYGLRIRPREDLVPGPFHFDVRLISRLESGETVTIDGPRVIGWVSAEVEPSPRALNFGMVRIGEVLESRFVLRSLVDKPFTITSIVSDAVDARVKSLESAENSRTVLIKQRATEVGDRTDRVVVTLNNHDGQELKACIPISYHGFHAED
jgi:hypothetical protein